ncbi:phytanoyl-CoA dioxygenase family protein [Tropicibacter sp. S64]|uniref:phytanoyl-CoA dioxygenase family protein n=1 Tax=Tropicibacter sp. S64 TaxID=3415122 RepID=UPI003C7AC9DF
MAFDKSDSQNWSLPWHQDRVVAVRDRLDVEGFTNWTRKDGSWHCEPPVALLQRMLFLRVHLDPSTEDNGAMQIALGSHRQGLIPSAQAASVALACPVETTEAAPGDLLVLKMLTLHRSCPSRETTPRRVLRLDLADFDLPSGLDWAEHG